MTESTAATYWAPRAWIHGRWETDVLLRVDDQGRWSEVRPGVPKPQRGAKKLPGPVLPSLVNAHSHAFQRAFAGMAERRESAHDDFWSWRDRMYGVALTITPERMLQVATHLYRELRAGGYGHVCEFHYLHHDISGKPYADPLTMSHALIQAAHDAGIGITLLPVLYERAGFDQPTLRDDQRRFATTVDSVLAMREGIRALNAPHVNVGVAIHSLRAARPESITRLVDALQGDDGPIHIHIAEQTGEVDDCIAATGHRPIEWLLRHVRLDARWQLVHATHATPQEIEGVACTGAGIVICPTTEANLGDGLPDLPRWLQARAPIAIGSDSQVGRDAREELRWLEYAQRLLHRRRNLAADPEGGQPSTAARLFELARAAGAAAAGFADWGLQVGAPADLLVLDAADEACAVGEDADPLGRYVFSPTPGRSVPAAVVRGRMQASA
jgi:formimidoylglutamate deiminase